MFQGDNRDDLRQLRTVMERSHDFLTNQEGIGLTLLDEVTKSMYILDQQCLTYLVHLTSFIRDTFD